MKFKGVVSQSQRNVKVWFSIQEKLHRRLFNHVIVIIFEMILFVKIHLIKWKSLAIGVFFNSVFWALISWVMDQRPPFIKVVSLLFLYLLLLSSTISTRIASAMIRCGNGTHCCFAVILCLNWTNLFWISYFIIKLIIYKTASWQRKGSFFF